MNSDEWLPRLTHTGSLCLPKPRSAFYFVSRKMFACMLSLLKLTLEASSSIESTLQKFIHEKSCLVLIGKIGVLYTQWSKILNQYLRRIPYSLRILMMRSWDDGTASLKREQLFFRNSLLKKTFSIAFERSWWVANFSKAFRESSSSTSPVFGEEGTEGIWAKVKLFDIFLLNAFSELMPFTVF